MGAAYAAVIVLSMIGVHGLVRRLRLPVRREVLLPVTVVTALVFLLIDAVGIWRGWFVTPLTSTMLMLPGHGALNAGLPIEEGLLLAGLAALVVVVMSSLAQDRQLPSSHVSWRRGGLAVGSGLLAAWGMVALNVGGEYTATAGALLVGAGVLTLPLLRYSGAARGSVALFLLLTLVFDNLMCALGLFSYASAPRSGLMVGFAPIEDLFYAGAFALIAAQLTAAASVQPGRWWRILLASRPVSWINTALPFAGGALAAGAGESIGVWFLPLLLWWGVAYNLYLYGINDLYDLATDRQNPRKGGAEGALLQDGDLPSLRRLLLICVASVVPFVLTGNLSVPITTILALLFATIYSAPRLIRARARPIVDSVISATHFVAPAVGGLALGGELRAAWIAPLAAFFFWNMASHVVGALQDVDADRASGIATVGTRFGVRGGGRFAAALYLVAAVLLVAQGEPLQRAAALLPLASVLSVLPLITGAPSHLAARAAWRRFMVLNLFLGAGAAILIIRSLAEVAAY